MNPGPHPYGDGRLGCWFTPVYVNGIPSTRSFSDKLRDRASRVRALGVTDAFLPREAQIVDKGIVRDADMFVALWEPPPAGKTAKAYAEQALSDVARLGVGALELNIEGVLDSALEQFVRDVVAAIRRVRPALRLRVNVVPFKGSFLPVDLFVSEPQLFVIVQNYEGNMDRRVAENEIERDLVDNGIPPAKVAVMYGAHIGNPRVPSLPGIRYRGSIYQDDLLADGGYFA